jgi:hypothetical protein
MDWLSKIGEKEMKEKDKSKSTQNAWSQAKSLAEKGRENMTDIPAFQGPGGVSEQEDSRLDKVEQDQAADQQRLDLILGSINDITVEAHKLQADFKRLADQVNAMEQGADTRRDLLGQAASEAVKQQLQYLLSDWLQEIRKATHKLILTIDPQPGIFLTHLEAHHTDQVEALANLLIRTNGRSMGDDVLTEMSCALEQALYSKYEKEACDRLGEISKRHADHAEASMAADEFWEGND